MVERERETEREREREKRCSLRARTHECVCGVCVHRKEKQDGRSRGRWETFFLYSHDTHEDDNRKGSVGDEKPHWRYAAKNDFCLFCVVHQCGMCPNPNTCRWKTIKVRRRESRKGSYGRKGFRHDRHDRHDGTEIKKEKSRHSLPHLFSFPYCLVPAADPALLGLDLDSTS